MNEDYILIGWREYLQNPIIVGKNIQWIYKNNLKSINSLSNLLLDRGTGILYIIIPQLYKLPNIRNIDLFSNLLSIPNTLLLDEDNNTILKGTGYTSGSPNKIEYYNMYKKEITEIEQKYPGLIIPIFVDKKQSQQSSSRENEQNSQLDRPLCDPNRENCTNERMNIENRGGKIRKHKTKNNKRKTNISKKYKK